MDLFNFECMKSNVLPYIITVVGPESSGKTLFAERLAHDLGGPWVPEYAREYLAGLERPYTLQDLYVIAERQWERIQLEVGNVQLTVGNRQWAVGNLQGNVKSYLLTLSLGMEDRGWLDGNGSSLYNEPGWDKRFVIYEREEFGPEPRPVVIIDSGMLTLRMWARIKFGAAIPLVEEWMSRDITSMYLLMRPLADWAPDPLREAPTLLDRIWIYNQYAGELARMMLTPRWPSAEQHESSGP